MRWLLFLLLIQSCFALEISEVYFDAEGNDDLLEFVELIGKENLSGCTITDSKYSDELVLFQTGGEIILIVEDESPYLELKNPTIYTIGKAIGNGLGNTGDNITVSCNETLLRTWYTAPEGFVAGKSLTWESEWKITDPTPGIVLEPPKEEVQESGSTEKLCNDTLLLTISNTKAEVGQTVTFTILSKEYAWWEASVDREVFSYGDTLTMRHHAFTTPNGTEVRLVAETEQCGARQRAVRLISITESVKEIIEEVQEEVEVQPPKPVMNITPLENTTTPVITGQIVYENEPNTLPWLSGFGIVVVLASSWAFWQASRDEKSI